MTLDQAKKHFNKGTVKTGVENLAVALDITTQAVYAWGGKIPRRWQLEIESITGGTLKADPIPRRKVA